MRSIRQPSAAVTAGADGEPARYRDLFAIQEFRLLFMAQAGSLVGSQLARVALSVLVFDRTGSTLLTGLIYALTFLPHLVGGVFTGIADRLPRRDVMLVCDLARAGLIALLVIPRLPIPLLAAIVVVAELFTAPFDAARAATMPNVLSDELYVLGSAVTQISSQSALAVGFAGGGVLVATLGVNGSLLIDSASFVASALCVVAGSRRRPAVGTGVAAREVWRDAVAGARLIFGDPRLRGLATLAWLCAFWVVPEGLAVPYAHRLGGGSQTAGLLLAAGPVGQVVGSVVLARAVEPARRLFLMAPLALLSVAPLMLCVLTHSVAITLSLIALSGLGASYNLPANTAFVAAVPDGRRAQCFGLVWSGILVGEGLTILLAGAFGDVTSPARVIAVSGLLGCVVVALRWSDWRRAGAATS